MQCPVLVKILVNEEVKDHTEDKEDVKIRFFLMRLRQTHSWKNSHVAWCTLCFVNYKQLKYIYIFYQGKKKNNDRCLCNIHIHVPVSKTISLYFFT